MQVEHMLPLLSSKPSTTKQFYGASNRSLWVGTQKRAPTRPPLPYFMQGPLRSLPIRMSFPCTCSLGNTISQAEQNGETPQFKAELTIMHSSLYLGESETGLSRYE